MTSTKPGACADFAEINGMAPQQTAALGIPARYMI